MKRFFAVMLILAMVLSCGAIADESVLVVSGSGSVSVDADWVSATVGVEMSGTDLTNLQQQVNAAIATICDALVAAGLEEKNISTNQFYVSPVYDYGGSGMFHSYDAGQTMIAGYTITNSLSIQTGDLDSIGAYIDAAFAAGANSFNSISFSARDDSEARKLALEYAVADARSKAEIIAAASGEELGGVLEIVEGGVSSYARSNAAAVKWSYDTAMAESASGASVHASQVVVNAEIQITYELK